METLPVRLERFRRDTELLQRLSRYTDRERSTGRERKQLGLALLLSLLIHALVLCLTFGGERFGLPGLD